MKILAIETSCDETAVALLEVEGDESTVRFKVLGNGLLSQIDIHKEYGGVYPALAKRAHAQNLVPVMESALSQGGFSKNGTTPVPKELTEILTREPELEKALRAYLETHAKPEIDAIAVTHGPGLAPALWVGVNFARALSLVWNIPIVPINHMEGHMLASLAQKDGESYVVKDAKLPLLALLISGGHTELVLMNDWHSYELLGRTRDDAVGEAYDKVARMMDLPYPGGPEISKLAEKQREEGKTYSFELPRPMIHSGDCDFSFSGLKTAVLYILKKHGALSGEERAELAHAFEDVVADALWRKTERALEISGARALVLGGGVSANVNIARVFKKQMTEAFPEVHFSIPPRELTTDNAIMIGLAGFYRARKGEFSTNVEADGNLVLAG